MKKVVIGSLMLTFIPLQPIIGYFLIIDWLKVPADSGVLFATVLFWCLSACLQLILSGGMIVTGYKELGVKTPFDV